MRKLAGIIVVGVAAVALAGWYFHGGLPVSTPGEPPQPPEQLQPSAQLPPPAAAKAAAIRQQPDVLYTWVDKDGVTHFEQKHGRGDRVVYDGSRITPLVTPTAPLRLRTEAAAAAVKEQSGEGLHKLRNELEAGAQRMREAKAAASPDL